MDGGALIVADGEAAKAVEPCQRSLNDPAVSAQPFAALDAASGNAGPDGAFPAFAPATIVIIGLVGVKLAGALARTSATVVHARHGIHSGCQHHAVVPVGRAQPDPGRGAFPVDHKMALRARLGPRSVGFGPVSGPPFRRHGGAVEGRAALVQMPSLRQLLEQHAMEPGPNASCLPVTQPASRSCLSSRTRAAASPRECRIAEQR